MINKIPELIESVIKSEDENVRREALGYLLKTIYEHKQTKAAAYIALVMSVITPENKDAVFNFVLTKLKLTMLEREGVRNG